MPAPNACDIAKTGLVLEPIKGCAFLEGTGFGLYLKDNQKGNHPCWWSPYFGTHPYLTASSGLSIWAATGCWTGHGQKAVVEPEKGKGLHKNMWRLSAAAGTSPLESS